MTLYTQDQLQALEGKKTFFPVVFPLVIDALFYSLHWSTVTMPIDPNVQRYLDFMQWFEQHYPALHAAHWMQIAIPATNRHIQILPAKLDPAQILEIEATIKDYYKSKK